MQDAPYLIKKYANRRLYDVAAGKFVTLAELDHIIRQGHDLEVLDAKGKDITRSILLQILAEREEEGEPILSIHVMHEMVRMYGGAAQAPFGNYLEEGMKVLHKQRQAWNGMLQDALRDGAPKAISNLLSEQLDIWNQSQHAFLRMWGKPVATSKEDHAPTDEK